jgi:hypothetical protein
MKKYILSIATIAALSVTGSVLAAPITIDTFDDGGVPYIVNEANPIATGTILSNHALGGSRTNKTEFVEGLLGGNTAAFDLGTTLGSAFTYSSDALTKIKSKITWDNSGSGLGGIDLTQGKALDEAYFSFNIIDIDQGAVNLGLTLEDTNGETTFVSSNQMIKGEDQRVYFNNFPNLATFAINSINSISIDISQSSFAADFIFDSFVVDFVTPPPPPPPLGSTPIPAAIWLFGSGLAGLVGMSKRKKNQGLAA